MKAASVLACAVLSVSGANAAELASCREPAGRAYFHFGGLLKKSDSGWQDDKITGGAFTLTQSGDSFDLLFVDWRKKPISSAQSGALVRVLRRGPGFMTLLVYYPDAATEIYSFFKEKDGSHRFALLQEKHSEDTPVPKSSLMVGACDPFQF